MPRKKELSFEESLTRLEAIVEQMDSGDLPLKDLMDRYTEGMALAKSCHKALSEAEEAMDVLIQDEAGEVKEAPLVIEEDS